MGALLKLLLKLLSKSPKRSPKPPANPKAGKQKANEKGNDAQKRDECVGDCKRKNDPIKEKEKLERQMKQRGWTHEQIEEAMKSGQKFPAKNMQTGGSATRYVHPKTGQSVVIDDTTGGIIHVGGPGFVY
ncbi:hypothetical protein FY136_21780 [Agrobacterium tumefaciens]|uniref:colicin E5-related ribonuclease n=1 Tax=Agrobacterium tumefaciens TaxID=358 RepID=UPI0021CE67A7|nr:colicin E5-related ribonuclease [Agrobacterium tumefaciens]UXT51853.1 hypothetical protein FY136_21780 [Agrobacterium tumefaciens]